MINTFTLSCHVANQISKTLPACELSNCHGNKLAPAVEGAEFLTLVVSICMLFEFMSREKSGNLIKDCFTIRHGSDLIVFKGYFSFSLQHRKLSEPYLFVFLYNFMRQQ